MTRLTKHYKKRILSYGILFAVLIIFLSTVGLSFIINASSFLSNLIGKRDATDNRNALLQRLSVDDVPTATNSAQIIVRGSQSSFDKITFYINNDSVKEIDADEDTFVEKIGDLNLGENEVYLIAEAGKNKKRSATYTVLFQKDKPKLEISDPKDNSITNKDEVRVSGTCDPDTEIKINGQPVVVDSKGAFSTPVRLKEGENKITVTATDPAGNSDEKILTVRYEKD